MNYLSVIDNLVSAHKRSMIDKKLANIIDKKCIKNIIGIGIVVTELPDSLSLLHLLRNIKCLRGKRWSKNIGPAPAHWGL